MEGRQSETPNGNGRSVSADALRWLRGLVRHRYRTEICERHNDKHKVSFCVRCPEVGPLCTQCADSHRHGHAHPTFTLRVKQLLYEDVVLGDALRALGIDLEEEVHSIQFVKKQHIYVHSQQDSSSSRRGQCKHCPRIFRRGKSSRVNLCSLQCWLAEYDAQAHPVHQQAPEVEPQRQRHDQLAEYDVQAQAHPHPVRQQQEVEPQRLVAEYDARAHAHPHPVLQQPEVEPQRHHQPHLLQRYDQLGATFAFKFQFISHNHIYILRGLAPMIAPPITPSAFVEAWPQ